MKRSFVTIRDIAKELGISISTVSRALRGHHEVNEGTRASVMRVAERLNYKPNPLALSLLKQHSLTIGVLIPEIANPFFSAIISGVEQVADARGYNLIICQSNEQAERERKLTDHLVGMRVEGLIVSVSAETRDGKPFATLLEQGFPIVFIDRTIEQLITHKVINDDFGGAQAAVQHLIEQGCRRIAHLAGPETLGVARNRHEGYREALLKAGLPYDPRYVVAGRMSQETGQQAAAELLSLPEPPDAIFSVNDRSAFGVMLEARRRGLRIPQDLALVGFGNLAVDELLQPQLTTVAQPAREMGSLAAELLFELTQDPEVLTQSGFMAKVKVIPTQLIVRESSMRLPTPRA